MLPAHGYPNLRKYKHLAGNFGSAWQRQKTEFADFGGPILVTTNCVLIPPDTYKDRLYTVGVPSVDGVKHIPDRNDFSQIIEHAKKIGNLQERKGRRIETGYHHQAVLSMAPQIIEAVKAGKIKRFFLIGGCDGATPGRDYYTQLAEKVPEDCVILTLACGKYRFNDRNFGTIEGTGIPRLLDLGQCNDAYSAIQIAVALSKAFGVDVNQLPLASSSPGSSRKPWPSSIRSWRSASRTCASGPHCRPSYPPIYERPSMRSTTGCRSGTWTRT
jgi:hydroxylamine reductase